MSLRSFNQIEGHSFERIFEHEAQGSRLVNDLRVVHYPSVTSGLPTIRTEPAQGRYAFTDSIQFGHLFPGMTDTASVQQPNPKH